MTIQALKKELKAFPKAIDGRVQFSLEYKLKVVEAAKASGMTKKAFGYSLGLKDPTLVSKWARTLTPQTIKSGSVSVSRLYKKDTAPITGLEAKRMEIKQQIRDLTIELRKLDKVATLLEDLGVTL